MRIRILMRIRNTILNYCLFNLRHDGWCEQVPEHPEEAGGGGGPVDEEQPRRGPGRVHHQNQVQTAYTELPGSNPPSPPNLQVLSWVASRHAWNCRLGSGRGRKNTRNTK